MRDFGFDVVDIPSPISIFTNIAITADGAMVWEPALAKAGDSVTFRAEMDCYVVLSACPRDVIVFNAGAPTPLEVRVLP